MGWECFCVVGFDLGPLLQGGTRILHLQYFFKYVFTHFLHLNSYLVTFLHNTICRAQLFCPFLLSASEFFSDMLFIYHLLYFCTALSLIIMLSSHYHLHKTKTLAVHGHSPLVILSILKEKYFTYVQEKYLSYLYQIWYAVYWVNSLHGIAFGEDSSIAN